MPDRIPVTVTCGSAWVVSTTRDSEDETSWVRVPAAAFCSSCNIVEQDISHQLAQVNSAFHPSRVDKSSTSFSWVYGREIASVRWQVKLCGPM